MHAVPKLWKLVVLNNKWNCKNMIYLNHHLIKDNQILATKTTFSKKAILFIYCSEKWMSYVPKILFLYFPKFINWIERDESNDHVFAEIKFAMKLNLSWRGEGACFSFS